MFIRSATAVAVAYMLIGALAKGFELAWRLAAQASPPHGAWLGWIAVASISGGWFAGFVAGYAPMRHAAALAGIAIVLGLVILLVPSGQASPRLSLLGCLAGGVMIGGLLRRLQAPGRGARP